MGSDTWPVALLLAKIVEARRVETVTGLAKLELRKTRVAPKLERIRR